MESIINLTDKKLLSITGCKKIISFNEQEFILETTLGNLQIKGRGLEMGQFEIEKGLLTITGEIACLSYETQKAKPEGFFKKLFK